MNSAANSKDALFSVDASQEKTIRQSEGDPAKSDYWCLSLIEMIHLLGLYLTHTRIIRGHRAAGALFDQLLRRLSLLKTMPGHDGTVILHRGHSASLRATHTVDYWVVFGSIHCQGAQWISGSTHQQAHSSHLAAGLAKAFRCLSDLGINGLLIRLPGESTADIDQLRLALNIVARYRNAMESRTAITFRYGERPITIPLVHDSAGRPDPNLTLLAGINGLSAVNAIELVKQAAALFKLSAESDHHDDPHDTYNRIFRTTALGSHLIQPLVEVNNTAWTPIGAAGEDGAADNRAASSSSAMPLPGPKTPKAAWDWLISAGDRKVWSEAARSAGNRRLQQTLHYLYACIDGRDSQGLSALETLFQTDFARITANELFQQLNAAIALQHAIARHTPSRLPLDRLHFFLADRLACIPRQVWERVGIQRQSIKVDVQGRTLLLGLVPAALLDVMAMVREREMLPRKIAVVGDHLHLGQPYDPQMIAALFDLADADALRFIHLLEACFTVSEGFDGGLLALRLQSMTSCGNALFEIMWCYLRQTTTPQEHLSILSAVQPQLLRIEDSKSALNYLLTDICQTPRQVSASDHDAFVLASWLLRASPQAMDIGFTPEEALDAADPIDPTLRQYASWRLEMDRERMIAKSRTMAQALRDALISLSGDAARTGSDLHLLLSLEREVVIFMGLAGGPTAILILRQTLARYGDMVVRLSRGPSRRRYLQPVMAQLQIAVRAIARVGRLDDLALLEKVQTAVQRLIGQDLAVSQAAMVKQLLGRITMATMAIQKRSA